MRSLISSALNQADARINRYEDSDDAEAAGASDETEEEEDDEDEDEDAEPAGMRDLSLSPLTLSSLSLLLNVVVELT